MGGVHNDNQFLSPLKPSDIEEIHFVGSVISFHGGWAGWWCKGRTQKQPPNLFCIKGVLKNFEKFTGKHRCQDLFFDKASGLHFIKKRPQHRCFLVNFVKFLRTFFFTDHVWTTASEGSSQLLAFKINWSELLSFCCTQDKLLTILVGGSMSIIFLRRRFLKQLPVL